MLQHTSKPLLVVFGVVRIIIILLDWKSALLVNHHPHLVQSVPDEFVVMTLLFGQDELDKATTTPPVQPLLVRVLRGGGRGGGGGRTSRGGGGGGDGSSSSNGKEEEDYTTGWGIGVVVLLVVVAIGLGQWFRRYWRSKRQGPKTNKNQESDQPTDTMAAALEPQAQEERRRRRRQDYASAYQAARQAVLGGEDDDDDDYIPNTEAPQPPLSVRNGLYKGTYQTMRMGDF